MKKKILIIIAVILVILLGIGLFTHYIDSERIRYELTKDEITSDIIYIELIFDGDIIEVADDKEIENIEKIILNKKYNGALCDGMYSHKITIGDEMNNYKHFIVEIGE